MKLTIALDQLSPKALTAIGNLQAAMAARQAAEGTLSTDQKKEEVALAAVRALGIHLTGEARTAPVKPIEIAVPEGMLTTRGAALKLGLALSTMSKFCGEGKPLPVAQRFKTPQGPSINLFHEADVEALRLKRELEKTVQSQIGKQSEPIKTVTAPKTVEAPTETAPTPAPPVKQTAVKQPPVKTQPLPDPKERQQLPAEGSILRPSSKKIEPPSPIFDTNENGKLAAIEEGKTQFKEAALFYLTRLTEGKKWLWDCQPNTVVAEGWEMVEEWRRNGLGRWESTPSTPGAVGTGNGVTHGIREGKLT